MVNKTYIENKTIYNTKRGLKSLMDNENIDENRALKIFNITKKKKDMIKNDKSLKKSIEYDKLCDEKLELLGFIPELYKENLAINKIMKLKNIDKELAKRYYYLSKSLLKYPKESEEYKNTWKARKELLKEAVIKK